MCDIGVLYYIVQSQVKVDMSTVELTWVWSIGCLMCNRRVVPVQWLSVDKRK